MVNSTPAALIDGQWVAPGQSVGKVQLLAVMRDAVRVRHPDGRVDTLSLSAGIRLQPPAARREAPTPAGSTR